MKVNNFDEDSIFMNYKELLAKARLKECQCIYCPPNKGENANAKKDRRSWKRYRKTQYKPKGG